MPRVDVHIAIGHDEPWLTDCVNSLMREDVNIWFVPKIEGDTAAAREAGFRKGSAPYVSFVDPDDLVVPGVFERCVAALDQHWEWVGCYTDESLITADGDFLMHGWSIDPRPFEAMGYRHELMQGIHHLRVLRRSIVERCLPLKTKRMPEPVLMHEMRKYGELGHIPIVGYHWRIHKANTFFTYTADELNEADRIARDLRSV